MRSVSRSELKPYANETWEGSEKREIRIDVALMHSVSGLPQTAPAISKSHNGGGHFSTKSYYPNVYRISANVTSYLLSKVR